MSLICPICQDNLINGQSTDNYVNKCGHVYHSACLLPWWDKAPESNCPECRQPCNMDTITKIFLTVDHSEVNTEKNQATPIGDLKTQTLLRQIKEHIDVQTYTQTKDINDKFRQQNSDFSTLLLNSNQRLTSNYNDKLSTVSKELTEVISGEHKRLLAESDSPSRPAHISESSGKRPTESGFRYSLFNYWKSKPVYCIGLIIAIFCFIALIAVLIYSLLTFHAIKSSKSFDEMKTNNVSQRLELLSQQLYQITDGVSDDIKNIKFDLENIRQLIKNGKNSQELLNRLGEISRKEDDLLLEQIQTDRRVNLKLEVLHNGINMLKAQIESANSSANSQEQTINRMKLDQLEEQNRQLEKKLQHLQTTLVEGRNLNAADLVKQIENDNELSVQTEQSKSVWEEPKELWRKFTDVIGVQSSSVGINAKVEWIFACTISTMIVSIFIV